MNEREILQMRVNVARDAMNAAATESSLALQQPEHNAAWKRARDDHDDAIADLKDFERKAAEKADAEESRRARNAAWAAGRK